MNWSVPFQFSILIIIKHTLSCDGKINFEYFNSYNFKNTAAINPIIFMTH